MKQFTFSSWRGNEIHTNFKITPETITMLESVEGIKKATPLDEISCYIAVLKFERGANVSKIMSDIADKLLEDDDTNVNTVLIRTPQEEVELIRGGILELQVSDTTTSQDLETYLVQLRDMYMECNYEHKEGEGWEVLQFLSSKIIITKTYKEGLLVGFKAVKHRLTHEQF